MAILMEEALKYALDPNVRRYGAILKNVNTGQIVGHLKETGEMGRLLANLPNVAGLNPLSIGVDLVDRAVKSYQIGRLEQSVDQIHKTLEGLEMLTNISAWSSVANLGVSTVGFALTLQKLSQIDSKLDTVAGGIEDIAKVLRGQDIKWEAMSTARLQRAAEKLIVSEQAESRDRQLELAKGAVDDFSLLRKYYSNLLREDGVFDNVHLSIDQLKDLIARYTFCCMGLLQAEFTIGDLGSYRKYLETVSDEYRDLVVFSPRELYLTRSDQLGVLDLQHDYKSESSGLENLFGYGRESADRVDSFMVELEYLDSNKLTVEEYLRALREKETDLVFLPRS